MFGTNVASMQERLSFEMYWVIFLSKKHFRNCIQKLWKFVSSRPEIEDQMDRMETEIEFKISDEKFAKLFAKKIVCDRNGRFWCWFCVLKLLICLSTSWWVISWYIIPKSSISDKQVTCCQFWTYRTYFSFNPSGCYGVIAANEHSCQPTRWSTWNYLNYVSRH